MKWWSPRVRRIAVVLVVLASLQALALVLYRTVEDQKHAAPPPTTFEMQALKGDPAPAIDLISADGSPVRWDDLRGKAVLVHFWASWCTPCRDEIPALLDVARKRHDKLRVLAISLDKDWAPVQLFFGGTIPNQVSRLAEDGSQQRYGVTTLPDTFVVSSSGKLLARLSGARDWDSPIAEQLLGVWEETAP